MGKKKVFVSGCFDMLHSGHIAFLNEASKHGDVYVGLGADETVYGLKGRYPVNNQNERKYILESLKSVKEVWINSGSGLMDFTQEIMKLNPDIFIVNEDGNTLTKEELCKNTGIEYKVLKRIPHANLPIRSTTTIRQECKIPFRIDLAGGWLDQPYVGKYAPGPVLTNSIEPTIEFNERSGMASSTRRHAIKLWQSDIPAGDKEHLAKVLFSFENPPGTNIVAGSQDSIGIVVPGLNRLDYNGGYWPKLIMKVNDESILSWIESHLYLVTLEPRDMKYDVLDNIKIDASSAQKLAFAADKCWDAILGMDIEKFGKYFRESFEAQIAMFPNMVDDFILKTIQKYKGNAFGWKLSGAGGGGYLILVCDKPVEGAMQIKIRRAAISN
ncbi:MAG: cytidyltransferase [Stygiobacter sp. RIFOXYC12_FULL_38_8]|nr:MAG: cytidyltransferase [Stygiobacter sp. RIFOXYC12_FULL_38_8]